MAIAAIMNTQGPSARSNHRVRQPGRAARIVGVLGFGVLFAVLLSAFTFAAIFFGFEIAGERSPYQDFLDSDFEPPAYRCLYKEQPCPSDPSEICCIPHPDAYFQFGTAE